MSDELKLNTAQHDRVLMISSTDDKTGATGLTLTITACKAGATTLTAIAPTVVEIGAGWYDLAFTAAHTDTLGALSVHITAAGADDNDVDYVVKQYTSDDLAALIDTLLGTPAGASVSADVAAVLAKILDAPAVRAAIGLGSANLDTQISAIETHAAAIDGRLPASPANETLVIAATDAIMSAITAIGALDAAGVRAAIGLASANLDTQLAGIPTADETAGAVFDLADAIETGVTFRQSERLQLAAALGNTTGMDTGNIAIRNAVANSKIRIVATGDASGNRNVTSTDAT